MKKIPVTPPVSPREAFTAYLALKENPEKPVEAIRQSFTRKKVSENKALGLLRFLRLIGLVEGRGEKIKFVKPDIEDFQEFYNIVSSRLREIYGELLNLVEKKPADPDIVYQILQGHGYKVSRTGVAKILRTLRLFGILVARKRIATIRSSVLDDMVYEYVVGSGGYSKIKDIAKTFGMNEVELRDVLHRLIRKGKLKLVGVPEPVMMVSRAINKLYNVPPEDTVLPTNKTAEYSKVVETLKDIYSLSEEDAHAVIQQALQQGKDVLKLYRDRVRGGHGVLEYIAGQSFLPGDYIVGVTK